MTEHHPLTSWQRDLWIAAALLPEHDQFTALLDERMEGDLDLDRFIRSVTRVLRRNDAINLRFDVDAEGTPYQWVSDEPLTIRRLDLSDQPDHAAACAAWLEEARRRSFPLRRNPLVEVTVIVESPRVTHLVLVAHHIVMDGASVTPLLQQIGEEYRRDTDASVAEPPSYLTVIHNEAAYRDSSAYERDRAAHREALTNLVPALFTRKAPLGERRHAQHTFVLDGATMDRIREAGFTPFPYLAAVIGSYLARVLCTEEVIIGVPLLNRKSRERKVIGHFANTLPLHIPALDGRPLRELVEHVHGQVTRLLRHGRVALGDVLRDRLSGADRQVFDTTLSFQQNPALSEIRGVSQKTAMLANGHEQDALNIYIRAYDGVDDVLVDLLYAEDVFDEDFPITAVADHVKSLISRGLNGLDRPVPELPLLTPDQHTHLVEHFAQGPQVAFDEDATLHGLFEAQAARWPGRTAVVEMATGKSLTYAELDARANRVARALRARGVGPDDRVAVALERCLDLPVALFGVLKAGGAYVPVDPGQPADRIRFLLQDSSAKAVLVEDWHSDAADDGADVYRIMDLLATELSDDPLVPLATSRDLAYVIYTSGSTGTPKGVMVEHRSVVNRLAWMQRAHPLTEADTLLQKTPTAFDVSVWELFWWAAEGARLALLPPGAEKDPKELLRAVRDHQVTALHFVPSMLGPFLELLSGNSGLRDDATHSLRTVFCSGEALPPAKVEQFARVLGGRPGSPDLVNLYGPTEATVDVTRQVCSADPARPVRRVPIGRPVDNTRTYVLDQRGEPQPAGVPGELCLAGVQVARGYLGRPDLTAAAFVEDPFVPGERMYRTGDIARWLADGSLEYLGRRDGQVKIRGNRVETGEVAAALAAVPGVYDAVVVDRTTPSLGTHLVGYYTAGHELTPQFLRSQMARILPEYMIPSVFQRIDSIPLTPNGKTDLRALPEPSAPAGGAGETPATPVERIIADIWAEVLHVEQVGRHDDYFALGGDSITLLRIRTLAEQRGLHLTLNDAMRHPTVAGLAAHITDREGFAEGDGNTDGDLTLAPFALVSGLDRARLTSVQDAHPVTRLQLGLLHHGHQDDRPGLYKDVFRYSVEADWSEDAFRRAFGRLVARHPVLRSSFDLARFSEPLHLVHAEVPDALEIADSASWPDDTAEREILAYADSRRVHTYVLGEAPLHRLRVYPRPRSVELVFSFHHAILDGASVANLIGELLRDYAHQLGADITPVPAGPLPHAALHVREERRALASPGARDHWRRLLSDAELLQLPALQQHQAPSGGDQIVHESEVPAEVMSAVRCLARENALPVKAVFLASYCLALRLFGGDHTQHVVTGVITHVRPEQAEAERLLGLFLNTVPVRLRTDAETWLDVAREALRQEQEGHAHRRYPLSAMQQDIGMPVTETAFNYVHFRRLADAETLPGVRLASIRTWEETSFTLLGNVIVAPTERWTRIRLDCDGRVMSRGQAALFADTWLAILDRVAQHPGERPDFAFLAAAPELTSPDEAGRATVVRLFTDQARRTPDAVALTADGRQWSYRQLADASEAVARRLIGLGMPAGARLGLAMDRSPEAIAVLIGILRAGAAVVPLDTGFPAERLKFMASQAEPFRIVVEERYAGLLGEAAELLPAEGIAEATDEVVELPEVAADSLAYVLFTSGSTGTPKGVAMPHRSLANLVDWQNRRPSGAVGGRTLQFAPLSFDVSLQEIFSTLCAGGTLCLASAAERRDPPALLRRLDREDVERIFLPYVALQQLAEAAVALGIAPRSLRVLVSSGEQLRVTDEIRTLLRGLPGAILENQYGPTESHVVTSFTMTGDPDTFPALPPIGQAVDNTRVLVLDARLRPVPPGVRGELYVGGVCLADGYLGRPDLTADRFIDDPSGAAGETLYRTGDIGLVLPSGEIVCFGRTDTQVKVRGYRVETAEVELAILDAARNSHPDLHEAAVVAQSHRGGDTFLAAFLVGDSDKVDIDALRARLRAVLPEYMLPTRFTWLPALPLTPSGKRDDAALRRISPTVSVAGPEARSATAHEQFLAEVVADLIQVPEVGVHDDIFALGTTSLTTMRLVVTIEQRYGVNIPVSAVLRAPTVAQLARLLGPAEEVSAFDPLVPIRPQGDKTPLFMAHPMGGNVLCYLPLARHLPDDQPLYALQAAGADPGTEPLRSLEALADRYVEAVRRVQPQGPYRIGGWSFGGYLAFEMARQLTAAGEDVADLFVLDTTAVTLGERHRHSDDDLLVWFFWELLLLERGGRSPIETIPAHCTTLSAKFEHISELAVTEGVLPAGSSGAAVRRLFEVYKANWDAALQYRPDRAPLDLTLIRAAEPLPRELRPMHDAIGTQYNDEANGWRELVDGCVTVVEVSGDHLTMVEEPHVAALASAMLPREQVNRITQIGPPTCGPG